MAASDHLNPQQFFHGTNAEFKPGDVLSREGAWRAKNPDHVAELDATKRDYGDGPYYNTDFSSPAIRLSSKNNQGHPVEDHLYVGDESFRQSGESGGYGKNIYQVEPVRKSTKFQPDPNYTDEGMTGAYRTKGQLRVVRKVN